MKAEKVVKEMNERHLSKDEVIKYIDYINNPEKASFDEKEMDRIVDHLFDCQECLDKTREYSRLYEEISCFNVGLDNAVYEKSREFQGVAACNPEMNSVTVVDEKRILKIISDNSKRFFSLMMNFAGNGKRKITKFLIDSEKETAYGSFEYSTAVSAMRGTEMRTRTNYKEIGLRTSENGLIRDMNFIADGKTNSMKIKFKESEECNGTLFVLVDKLDPDKIYYKEGHLSDDSGYSEVVFDHVEHGEYFVYFDVF